MGVDVGTVRIGLSISDATGRVAGPLGLLERNSDDEDAEQLLRIAEENEVRGFVFGLPLHLDGREGDSVENARSLARHVKSVGKSRFEIWLYDERYTTNIAERILIQADMSRRKRKLLRDKMAAVVLLQGFLDRLAQGGHLKELCECN